MEQNMNKTQRVETDMKKVLSLKRKPLSATSSAPPAPKKPRKESHLEFGGDTQARGKEKDDVAALMLANVQPWKDSRSARLWKHVPLVFLTKDGRILAHVLLRRSSAIRDLCRTKTCTCNGKQVDIVQICVATEHQRKGWGTRLACAIYRVAAAFGRSLYLEQCITKGSQKLGASLLRRLNGSQRGESYFYECGQVQTLAPMNDGSMGSLRIVSKKLQPELFGKLYAQLMNSCRADRESETPPPPHRKKKHK